jgi:hypothetical protein
MSNLKKVYDDVLIYGASSNKGTCRIQIFHRNPFYLVFFTELDLNTGPSVTNSIEKLIEIAQGLFLQWGIQKEHIDDLVILYAERYEEHPEYFDWVQLGSNKQPIWTRASAEEIRVLLPLLDKDEK